MKNISFSKNKKIRYITVAGIVFMNIGALFLLVLSFYHYHEFHKISNYEHRQGVITEVSVLVVYENDEYQLEEAKAFDPLKIQYKVDVKYEYKVDGRRYENNKVFAGTFASNLYPELAQAKQKAIAYKDSPSVTVYFDPTNPELSVLDPRMILNRRLLVASFILIVAGISSALALIVMRIRKTNH